MASKKNISISIRISEEELQRIKQATEVQAYSSYSEFIRRTVLIETARILKEAGEGSSAKRN